MKFEPNAFKKCRQQNGGHFLTGFSVDGIWEIPKPQWTWWDTWLIVVHSKTRIKLTFSDIYATILLYHRTSCNTQLTLFLKRIRQNFFYFSNIKHKLPPSMFKCLEGGGGVKVLKYCVKCIEICIHRTLPFRMWTTVGFLFVWDFLGQTTKIKNKLFFPFGVYNRVYNHLIPMPYHIKLFMKLVVLVVNCVGLWVKTPIEL